MKRDRKGILAATQSLKSGPRTGIDATEIYVVKYNTRLPVNIDFFGSYYKYKEGRAAAAALAFIIKHATTNIIKIQHSSLIRSTV